MGTVAFAGRPMKRKERYIVRLDEVMLTRGSDYADIEYKEPGVPGTRPRGTGQGARGKRGGKTWEKRASQLRPGRRRDVHAKFGGAMIL